MSFPTFVLTLRASYVAESDAPNLSVAAFQYLFTLCMTLLVSYRSQKELLISLARRDSQKNFHNSVRKSMLNALDATLVLEGTAGDNFRLV
jgi:hypothetical protein